MIKSSKLSQYSNIWHGFSTVSDGDLLSKSMPLALITAQQIHGNNIAVVDNINTTRPIVKTDGMITALTNIALVIKTADCVPLLLFDPINKIIGIAHAGWRGTLSNISREIVDKMKKSGSDPKGVVAIIGPHIGACCYSVDKERISLFNRVIDYDSTAIITNGSKYYLDLGKINYQQLVSEGIKPQNIESDIYCTSCQKDLFFSFRRDKQNSGRMLNFICLRN